MQVVWGNNKSERKIAEGVRMKGNELVNYFSEDLFIANLKAKTKERSFDEFAELFKDKNPKVLLDWIDTIYKPEGFHEVFNVVCFRKINDEKFKYPLQGKYTKDVEGLIPSS